MSRPKFPLPALPAAVFVAVIASASTAPAADDATARS